MKLTNKLTNKQTNELTKQQTNSQTYSQLRTPPFNGRPTFKGRGGEGQCREVREELRIMFPTTTHLTKTPTSTLRNPSTLLKFRENMNLNFRPFFWGKRNFMAEFFFSLRYLFSKAAPFASEGSTAMGSGFVTGASRSNSPAVGQAPGGRLARCLVVCVRRRRVWPWLCLIIIGDN